MRGLTRSLGRAKAGVEASPKRVRYNVRDLSITVSAGVAAVGFGTTPLGGLPEGNILFQGGIAYLQFLTADTDIIATWSGNYAVGTVATADNDVADPGEANLIASASISAATAKLSPVTRGELATQAMIDNTAGTLNVNLNMLVADASITDSQSATFTVNGYVELVYIVLGDD